MSAFAFGLMADAQYADLADGDTEGRAQRYREVPAKLREALRALRASQPPLDFVLHLGDIIHGSSEAAQTAAELDFIAGIFEQELGGAVPALHVLGNHCLEAGRAEVTSRLSLPACGFYTRELPHGWRLILLDTTEMSTHSGYPAGSWQWDEARAFHAAHPLSAEHPQMRPWNGGVTSQQLGWLRRELAAAEAAGQRVIVAAHHQVGVGAARPTHMALNWEELQAVLLAAPAFRLALAGHDHVGGYAQLEGRHFVTAQAMLESPSGSNSYAVVHVYADRVEVLGSGSMASRVLHVQRVM